MRFCRAPACPGCRRSRSITVARFISQNEVRTAKRESRNFHHFVDADFADECEEPPPEKPFDVRDIVACAGHLASLPPACQMVVRLHYLEEMTQIEIAEAIEIPVGTVKSRLSYGLARLRKLMLTA